jgi:DeoR family fructose operon transcriptional repressor
MFSMERKQRIEELIKQNTSVAVNDLAIEFNASESTIRRDLKEMEASGLLIRTHGGAMEVSKLDYEMSFREKEIENISDKQEIAEIAAAMIEDGDTIILDSGTTTLEIAKRITAKSVTVITNSIDIALEISNKENIELIVAGGSLRHTTRAMIGPLAENVFRNFRVDKAFIGVNGISIKHGFTTPNFLEAQLKKSIIEVARKKIIVADKSKFNKVCFSIIGELKEASSIVTSKDLEKEMLIKFKELGVDIITH